MSDQRFSANAPPHERPSVCRNCGAIVGAGETVCAQCGLPLQLKHVAGDPRRPVYDHETMRFARAVLTRPHTFSILFLVANIFVFMLMWSSSGLTSQALFGFPFEVLVVYGAKLNNLINAPAHQWWRFITPIFIHVNLPHLIVNMWGLWMIGPYVEKLYGSAKFVLFWVLTGVAGVMASYLTVWPDMHVNAIGRFLFKSQDNPSAGASGALFGLVGVLFVFGIKYRKELPEGFKRMFGTGLLPTILLNLLIGFLGQGFIDNAAHLGGFFAGAVLALFVDYRRPGERGPVAVFWLVLQVLALTLVVVSFVMVARKFPDVRALRQQAVAQNGRPTVAQTKAYIDAINQGQQALYAAVNEGDAGALDPAIKALGEAPKLDDKAAEIANDLKSLLERAQSLMAMQPGQARNDETEKIEAAYQAWLEKRNVWIKERGDKYGIVLPSADENKTDAEKK